MSAGRCSRRPWEGSPEPSHGFRGGLRGVSSATRDGCLGLLLLLLTGAALAQPQVAHRGTIQTVNEPGIGDLRLFNLTAKFEKTPASIDAPPPRLSAHTDAILGGLGYTAEAITALRQKGVV